MGESRDETHEEGQRGPLRFLHQDDVEILPIPPTPVHSIHTFDGSSYSHNVRSSNRASIRSILTARPLSFNGSIWLKDPEDIVPQFEFSDDLEKKETSNGLPTHSFDRKKKRRLVYLVSMAAIFSPLSSNIYFPAIDTISKILHTRIELIALTVTIYMLFQGLAPSFWGPLADSYGRRPILILTLLVYIGANVGLGLSKSFATLMVFRAFQAIGSSSTIAIGAGVIGDFSAAAERGGFMGLFGGIRMFGQAIGPVFGGTLSEYLGFRSIFYFLLGLAFAVLVSIVLFLPETLRKIAGNGTVPLTGIYRPAIYSLRRVKANKDSLSKTQKPSFKSLFDSFRLLAEKDVAVTLVFGGIIYTVWSMITSSTSSLWKEEYKLSDVQVGLVFIPNGLGCVLGSLITGKIMDRDYKREEVKYRERNNLPKDTDLSQHSYLDFPLERARLAKVWWLIALFSVATATYGFSVEWHIAIPLSIQFITAFAATAIFNINSTLMIDLYPSRPATATAINNLVRCTMGGIGVGFVERSIRIIDEDKTFLCLAAISLSSSALVLVTLLWGPKWRKARLLRNSPSSSDR